MASQAQTQFFLKESEINCHVFSQDPAVIVPVVAYWLAPALLASALL